MDRVRVRYTGRVQGVGFRATVLSIAQGHPVTGWVRNDPDGSVMLEAQGESGRLRAFLEAIAERMGALVATVDEAPAVVQGGETDFEIRR